jgi:hypothetical protein
VDEDVILVERFESSVVSTQSDAVVTVVVETPTVVTDEMRSYVTAETTEVSVVAVGQQGPAGSRGPVGPSGGSALTVTAGAALGGHRVVYLDAFEKAQYASNQTASHALVMLGMTLGAAVLDDPVDVQRSGEVTEPTWDWILEQPVYLGDNGLLTQTPPNSPALFQRIVGFPITATTLFLALREPVFIT